MGEMENCYFSIVILFPVIDGLNISIYVSFFCHSFIKESTSSTRLYNFIIHCLYNKLG